jgi:hypothetical protein
MGKMYDEIEEGRNVFAGRKICVHNLGEKCVFSLSIQFGDEGANDCHSGFCCWVVGLTMDGHSNFSNSTGIFQNLCSPSLSLTISHSNQHRCA